MKPFKTRAYIQSLNKGKLQSDETDEITVLEKVGDNNYIVDYKGIKCTAIFNCFSEQYCFA